MGRIFWALVGYTAAHAQLNNPSKESFATFLYERSKYNDYFKNDKIAGKLYSSSNQRYVADGMDGEITYTNFYFGRLVTVKGGNYINKGTDEKMFLGMFNQWGVISADEDESMLVLSELPYNVFRSITGTEEEE